MPNVRQVILETINRRGPLVVEEIARAVKLSKMATRYHLGLLARENLVVRTSAERTGGVGRPQAVYALGDRACEHLPKQYHRLAECLLDECEKSLGQKETVALLRRAGQRMAGAVKQPHRTLFQQRVAHTVKLLNNQGYAAKCGKVGGDVALTVCNCPYRNIAEAHPAVCDMDLAMIRALLRTPVQLTRHTVQGTSRCRFSIGK